MRGDGAIVFTRRANTPHPRRSLKNPLRAASPSPTREREACANVRGPKRTFDSRAGTKKLSAMTPKFLAVGWVTAMLVGCAVPTATVPVQAMTCPVSNITTARQIAAAVIAQNTHAAHVQQVGYRLDITDEGEFWLVHDGPRVVERSDAVAVQAGGSSIQLRIAKCTGAVSDFNRHVWR